ncbi:acyl-CoA dehydrogenase family protein [Filimonas effusa]|uniref:Acyl-CoA dehydrogenase n=1 Tax=Filimonas effusa TaxID=2508721 RepID=A0A4Q1D1D1_9BACT|nr:acyl-CoA dehydrogenase [Filimonas effusa]RXK80901.1 acyl-CoA dehydrogenase [Filimonas effusa]
MIQIRPSTLLAPESIAIIRNAAAFAEQEGMLQSSQLTLAYEQQWFSMMVPGVYGGGMRPLPEVVRLEEAIAWADGSMGWVVTLCAGAGWFGGFMPETLARQVFDSRRACLAGSGAATGTAAVIPGGYKVSGKWWHASGAPHNTVFTANCIIVENDVPCLHADGSVVIKPFAFFRNEVTIIPTWNSFGLVATASHAFEVNGLEVSPDRAFAIEASSVHIDASLYRYPFLQLAEITLAANISGMAFHFIDEASAFLPLKKGQEQQLLQMAVDRALENIEIVREAFYAAIDNSWWQLQQQNKIETQLLEELSSVARALAATCREQTDDLYPYCGLKAADKDSTINRVWRDLHTASQHSLLVFPRV